MTFHVQSESSSFSNVPSYVKRQLAILQEVQVSHVS